MCSTSSTGEDDHLICIHKFSSSDYPFVYASDENNAVNVIKTNPDREDIPEDEIPYEAAFDL